MAKTFLQIFEKYVPSERDAKILDSASNIKVSADKQSRMLQVSCSFDKLVRKETLYKIESDIAKAYQLNWVKILPRYPANLFDSDYISELLLC